MMRESLLVCALLFCLMAEGVTENRKDGKVVYRYHGNVEEVLLDSLKAAMPTFPVSFRAR